MPVYHFQLTPLSPVHVGAGEPIAAEDYFLRDGKLTRFLPAAVARAMTAQERQRYLGLLSGPPQRLDEALRMLRQKAMQTPGAWIYSIDVEPEAHKALAEVIDKLDTRRGDVRPLQWNLAKRVAILPGSAIKGAIRTAVLSAIVARTGNDHPQLWADWNSRLPKLGSTAREPHKEARGVARFAQDLERDLLRRGEGIEMDPFRFLKISDIEVPPQHVRLDRALLFARSDRADARVIQMHFERLLSWADSGKPPSLNLEFSIEQPEKSWNSAMKPYLQDCMRMSYLRTVLNWHYKERLDMEKEKFPELSYDKIEPHLAGLDSSGGILLRIGRFSHFESLSVGGLRRTLNRRGEWVNIGTSRTYCAADQNRKLPFGWVLLTPVGKLS